MRVMLLFAEPTNFICTDFKKGFFFAFLSFTHFTDFLWDALEQTVQVVLEGAAFLHVL